MSTTLCWLFVKNYDPALVTVRLLFQATRRCLQGHCANRIVGRISCEKRAAAVMLNDPHADSFGDFFSVAFASPDEEVLAGSFPAADFSPPSAALGADSFLAASLYESLR